MAAKKAVEAQPDQAGANFIKVPAFNFRTLVVTVRGVTPLIGSTSSTRPRAGSPSGTSASSRSRRSAVNRPK